MTAVFAKVGLEDVAPDFATLVRTIVIAETLGGLVWATGKWQDPLKLSVALVAVFAVVFLGERPGGREWLGIALVGAGVLLMSLRR